MSDLTVERILRSATLSSTHDRRRRAAATRPGGPGGRQPVATPMPPARLRLTTLGATPSPPRMPGATGWGGPTAPLDATTGVDGATPALRCTSCGTAAAGGVLDQPGAGLGGDEFPSFLPSGARAHRWRAHPDGGLAAKRPPLWMVAILSLLAWQCGPWCGHRCRRCPCCWWPCWASGPRPWSRSRWC